MKITILTDNPKSWFLPYGHELVQRLQADGHEAGYVFNAADVPAGDICFLLSCVRLVPAGTIALNKKTIVVHASDLPEGKGFSPLQWQIVEGRNHIVLTLFEVVEAVDAGPYYLKETLHFDGSELLDELHRKMAEAILGMCVRFANECANLPAMEQAGVESFYRRRTAADDELDVNKTIAEQFNHLRIANNDVYPIYFKYKGNKYILKIYKEPDATGK